MRVLIADDDEVSNLALQGLLTRRGYGVTAAANGEEAWQILQGEDPPPLAVLDWMMPGLDGLELCRRVRATPKLRGLYLILLTSRDSSAHVVAGLRAGANDYVTKPFQNDELEARLNVGMRVVELQAELAQRVQELESALAQVKQLHTLLPICSYCKKIRDDQNYWEQVDGYLLKHSEIRFSHGVCPECWENVVKPEIEKCQIENPQCRSLADRG
jgi:sigma-B regulation protein RsbU (phosphoserine phosphatase)